MGGVVGMVEWVLGAGGTRGVGVWACFGGVGYGGQSAWAHCGEVCAPPIKFLVRRCVGNHLDNFREGGEPSIKFWRVV